MPTYQGLRQALPESPGAPDDLPDPMPEAPPPAAIKGDPDAALVPRKAGAPVLVLQRHHDHPLSRHAPHCVGAHVGVASHPVAVDDRAAGLYGGGKGGVGDAAALGGCEVREEEGGEVHEPREGVARVSPERKVGGL